MSGLSGTGADAGKKNAAVAAAACVQSQQQSKPTGEVYSSGHAVNPSTQCGRVLARLRLEPTTTLQFHAMCILAPAARILELKAKGFVILTTRLKNSVARYTLMSTPARKGGVSSPN